MIPSVRPKFDRPVVESFLRTLHETISSIPGVPPQHPLVASRSLLKAGVAVPYVTPLPTEETNWKVAFQPPASITVVGSWANKLSVKPKDGERDIVDLAVQMPNVGVLILAGFCQFNTNTGLIPRERLSEREVLSQAGILPFRHRGARKEISASGCTLRFNER